jgi:hypothetical protein
VPDSQETRGHWRQVADVSVDDAEERADRFLVGGDAVEIADLSLAEARHQGIKIGATMLRRSKAAARFPRRVAPTPDHFRNASQAIIAHTEILMARAWIHGHGDEYRRPGPRRAFVRIP